jgi:hypothetical protein
LIRCRLQTVWTLLSKMGFFGLVGAELVILGFAGSTWPWLWAILLSLPLFVLWINKQQRDLRRVVATFLDEVAKEMRLIKVERHNLPPIHGPISSRSFPQLAIKNSDGLLP